MNDDHAADDEINPQSSYTNGGSHTQNESPREQAEYESFSAPSPPSSAIETVEEAEEKKSFPALPGWRRGVLLVLFATVCNALSTFVETDSVLNSDGVKSTEGKVWPIVNAALAVLANLIVPGVEAMESMKGQHDHSQLHVKEHAEVISVIEKIKEAIKTFLLYFIPAAAEELYAFGNLQTLKAFNEILKKVELTGFDENSPLFTGLFITAYTLFSSSFNFCAIMNEALEGLKPRWNPLGRFMQGIRHYFPGCCEGIAKVIGFIATEIGSRWHALFEVADVMLSALSLIALIPHGIGIDVLKTIFFTGGSLIASIPAATITLGITLLLYVAVTLVTRKFEGDFVRALIARLEQNTENNDLKLNASAVPSEARFVFWLLEKCKCFGKFDAIKQLKTIKSLLWLIKLVHAVSDAFPFLFMRTGLLGMGETAIKVLKPTGFAIALYITWNITHYADFRHVREELFKELKEKIQERDAGISIGDEENDDELESSRASVCTRLSRCCSSFFGSSANNDGGSQGDLLNTGEKEEKRFYYQRSSEGNSQHEVDEPRNPRENICTRISNWCCSWFSRPSANDDSRLSTATANGFRYSNLPEV